MGKVVNLFVSREINAPDATWLSCKAHIIHTSLIPLLIIYCDSSVFKGLVKDCRNKENLLDPNRCDKNLFLTYFRTSIL